MSNEYIYNIWAPIDSPWSNWVKPVLFACMDSWPLSEVPWYPEEIGFIPPVAGTVAIVADLPGDRGVSIGISLALNGYQPVPLYNALPGPTFEEINSFGSPIPVSLIDVAPIINALRRGTLFLSKQPPPTNAPPVFLLDANRRAATRPPSPGTYDNRSITFVTDFPSANYLLSHGITEVLLLQENRVHPQSDLAHTLRRWQDGGIIIKTKDLFSPIPAIPLTVEKPTWYGAIWYRVLVALGLRRSELGGFGGLVPFPGGGGG